MSITLKAARVNKQLTQSQAADLLNVSLYTLQNYESGKTYPDVPAIKRIEALYGIPFSDIDFLCPKVTI